MALTAQQKSTLLAYINQTPELASMPLNSDGSFAIADALNKPASPAFYVYDSQVDVQSIFDAVKWANYDQVDALDGTTAYQNRILTCMMKRDSLWAMTSRLTFNATKANLRTGLQNATSGLPSGVGGANRTGGWTDIQLLLSRPALLVEQLLATGTGTQSVPAVAGFEGTITTQMVSEVRGF